MSNKRVPKFLGWCEIIMMMWQQNEKNISHPPSCNHLCSWRIDTLGLLEVLFRNGKNVPALLWSQVYNMAGHGRKETWPECSYYAKRKMLRRISAQDCALYITLS